jgi:hypothetical protein
MYKQSAIINACTSYGSDLNLGLKFEDTCHCPHTSHVLEETQHRLNET